MDKEYILTLISSFIVLIFVILALSGCVYKMAKTDFDCWLSVDPILCQKLKDKK